MCEAPVSLDIEERDLDEREHAFHTISQHALRAAFDLPNLVGNVRAIIPKQSWQANMQSETHPDFIFSKPLDSVLSNRTRFARSGRILKFSEHLWLAEI